MVWTVVIVSIIVLVTSIFYMRRYEMSEKVDKGFELCYWKLSYRRKLIRTLWTIPAEIIVVMVCYKVESDIEAGVWGVILFLLTFVQAAYNYVMWKQGE